MFRWLPLLSLFCSVSANACVKAELLETAQGQELEALTDLNSTCIRGLQLLREGHGAQALPLLVETVASSDLLAKPIELPLAEAKYLAGVPARDVLMAWERVVEPADLVKARQEELVERLPHGMAKTLLKLNPQRPSASLLRVRALRDSGRRESEKSNPQEPIQQGQAGRIGVLLPLSGPLSRFGSAALRGMRVGLNKQTTLIVRDTGGKPERVPQLVDELNAERITAIVGPIDRESSRIAAESAERLKIPILRLSVAGENAETWEWVFRSFISRDSHCRSLVNHAMRRGIQRFAVVHAKSKYGSALSEAFQKQVLAAGGEVAVVAEYPPNSKDLTDVAKTLKSHKFGALFVGEIAVRAGRVLRFIAREDIWTQGSQNRVGTTGKVRYVQLMGPSEWYGESFANDNGRYVLGAFVATEWTGPHSTETKQFTTKMQRAFGVDPSLFEAAGYDGVRVLQRLRSASRSTIREGLRRKTGFDGLLGWTRYDQAGEPRRTVRLYKVGQRGFQPVSDGKKRK